MQVTEINKSISYHCSRHTFATTSRSLVPEYDVISKTSDHTDIKITKVYAKFERSYFGKTNGEVEVGNNSFCVKHYSFFM